MPAFVLLLGIKRVIVPLPWFVVWLILLPAIPFVIIASIFFRDREYGKVMQNAHLAWWVLVTLHGLRVDVKSKNGDRVYLSFV